MAFVKEAHSDDEILACLNAAKVSRPKLSTESFLSQVKQQQSEGYHLLYRQEESTQKVVSILGFRQFTMLYFGNAFYLEDLATVPEARRQGYASELFQHFQQYAKDNSSNCIVTDSDALEHEGHRFLLNKGFDLTNHHFDIRNIQSTEEERPIAYEVKEAKTDEEIQACWDVVRTLRQDVQPEAYLPQVKLQQKQGYHLVYIEDPATNKAVSYLGFRQLTMFLYGQSLYIEDLATMPEVRGKGMAKALFDFFMNYAKANGYDSVVVDSMVTRHAAHRFYLNMGFDITGHRFEIRKDRTTK